MYKLCKTEQSAQRQRQLEQGLLDMMLQHRYEDLSVSDLCDYMQIPRKSFYRYFSSKDGCLFALLDHTMLEYLEIDVQTQAEMKENWVKNMDRFFLFWRKRSQLLDALQQNRLSGILVERAMALTLQEKLLPVFVHNWNPQMQQLAATFSVCGLLSMVIQWHAQNFSTLPSEMTQIAVSMLTKPLIQ